MGKKCLKTGGATRVLLNEKTKKKGKTDIEDVEKNNSFRVNVARDVVW